MSVLCPFWQSNFKSKRTNHQESWNNMKQLLRQFDIRFMTYPLPFWLHHYSTNINGSMVGVSATGLGDRLGWYNGEELELAGLPGAAAAATFQCRVLWQNPKSDGVFGFSLIIHEKHPLEDSGIYIYVIYHFMTIVIIYIHKSNGIVYRKNWKCEVELAKRGTTLYCNKHAKNRCTIQCKDLELAKIP